MKHLHACLTCSALFWLNALGVAQTAPISSALLAQQNPQSQQAQQAQQAAPLPTDSVYQLPVQLVDQSGRNFALSSHRGQPMLVSMFYTSCQFVCPMLVETIRHTQAQLSAAQRDRLAVLMVTFDPTHDTVAVLKQTAEQRQLDANIWQLARTDASSVRKIAAVLGVQYRALGNGDFKHTTTVLLLDGEGRIKGRTSQLGSADPEFVRLVKATLEAATP
jgi:protein SCO1